MKKPELKIKRVDMNLVNLFYEATMLLCKVSTSSATPRSFIYRVYEAETNSEKLDVIYNAVEVKPL